MKPSATLLLVVLAAACGGSRAPGTAAAAPCVPEQLDSAWMRLGPVYRECEVETVARETFIPRPSGPIPGLGTQSCHAALIEFVVDTLGRVEMETARIVRTNSPQFARAAINNMQGARYQPATREGRKVRQVVRGGSAIQSFTTTTVVRGPPGSIPTPPTPTGPPPGPPCRA